MNNPRVTIIIPVYNGTNFMCEAIDSALAQTYKNLEIIVVDDGSTDDGATERTALSYGDKIKYIKKQNGGVSSALNMAIESAEGEYYSWLSHDDLYYPDKIEKEVNFLNKILRDEPNEDRNKIVIHCATKSIDKDGRIIKIPSYHGVKEKENSLDVIIDNVYHYRLSGCSFLIPKSSYYDIGGFREDIRTVSDVEYWYRLLFHDYHFFCLPKDRLVKSRSHGKQVGKTKVELFEKELNDLYIYIADQLMQKEEYNTVSILEKYYLGLVKRNILVAAEYVKKNGLEKKKRPFISKITLSIKKAIWIIRGQFVNFARIVFRKIMVK